MPGIWRVDYTTQFTNASVYNKSCHAHVFAQTDLQAFYGFTAADDSQFNDMPQAEPLAKSSRGLGTGIYKMCVQPPTDTSPKSPT
jgi:hypothetical protein